MDSRTLIKLNDAIKRAREYGWAVSIKLPHEPTEVEWNQVVWKRFAVRRESAVTEKVFVIYDPHAIDQNGPYAAFWHLEGTEGGEGRLRESPPRGDG